MLSSLPPSFPSISPTGFPASVSPRVQASGSQGTGVSPSTTEPPAVGSRATEAPGEARSAENSPRAGQDRQSADNAQGLTDAELKQLSQLKARDREVRAHEAAHQAVGGQYAGAISYTYQRGPDGAQYAVGGEVSIDVSPVQGDPQATIEKMRVVRAAALAPAEPSGQDRAVAAQAMQIMLQAQAELAAEVGTPESSKAASETYREISAFGDPEESGRSSFEPVTA